MADGVGHKMCDRQTDRLSYKWQQMLELLSQLKTSVLTVGTDIRLVTLIKKLPPLIVNDF